MGHATIEDLERKVALVLSRRELKAGEIEIPPDPQANR